MQEISYENRAAVLSVLWQAKNGKFFLKIVTKRKEISGSASRAVAVNVADAENYKTGHGCRAQLPGTLTQWTWPGAQGSVFFVSQVIWLQVLRANTFWEQYHRAALQSHLTGTSPSTKKHALKPPPP